ncbi:uncharacterized protein A4U43_C02F2420 [Asparagus officinalis]|uniref:Protein kinase domain-containing protein n=1 Tax=Asparagus officinalis TaxID=4686 RepID=A0A5P1FG42_ASPOF|nr:probable serine/threonine-protein kinase PBL25 [Asparagus officinalis]ONK77034.1 uncharacterized protein A4U43_C02F2420 [Asparagus officinalis]
MNCFPCFGGGKKEKKDDSSSGEESNHAPSAQKKPEAPKPRNSESTPPASTGNIQSQNFTFRELATATKNFTPDNIIGEGGLGRVYKGFVDSIGMTVAVKQLDRNSLHGNKEFLVEVMMLSLLHHPNLVNLVGYCADGDQRLLVYEYMANGTLQDHLHDLKPNQKPLDWYTRMKIAFGAAQGLEYLHDKANPPIIYRDMKTANILLNDLMTPKLSDFGLAKLNPMGDSLLVSSSAMGTYGYTAPECSRNGERTMKSDVYSFGVVLLELISGRKASDSSKPVTEQNLVTWAQPMFREQKKYPELADPILQGDYPLKSLNQAVAVVAMCLQEEASVRPLMADVVMTLSFLIEPMPTPQTSPTSIPDQTPPPQVQTQSQPQEIKQKSSSSSSDEHVVETLQLGLTSRRSQAGSKPPSRTSSIHSSSSNKSSSSSSRQSSRKSSRKNSKKHRKESFRQISDASSISKEEQEQEQEQDVSDHDGSDSNSSSKYSRDYSNYGSSNFMSLKITGGSSKHGSQSSVSKEGSEHGSEDSVSRHSEESEHEYESD